MSDLTSLAERCEAATRPDRELDREIALAMGWRLVAVPYLDGARIINEWKRPKSFGLPLGTMADPPFFTASIDAAMTLVPDPGEQFSTITSVELWGDNGVYPEHVRASAWVIGARRCYAAAPALALCAAAIRARAANLQRTGEERVQA